MQWLARLMLLLPSSCIFFFPLLTLQEHSIQLELSLSLFSLPLAERLKTKQDKSCSIIHTLYIQCQIALISLCAHSYLVVLMLVACPLLGQCNGRPRDFPWKPHWLPTFFLKDQLNSNQSITLFGQQCQAISISFLFSFACLISLIQQLN